MTVKCMMGTRFRFGARIAVVVRLPRGPAIWARLPMPSFVTMWVTRDLTVGPGAPADDARREARRTPRSERQVDGEETGRRPRVDTISLMTGAGHEGPDRQGQGK